MIQFLTLATQDVAEQTIADGLQQVSEAATQAASQGNAGHLILLLTVFALAVFVVVEIISNIPPTLHTPLMSGSNAISGITLVGAILATGGDNGRLASILGFSAVVFATMNVVGGFVVTNRMLAMFKTRR